ncbi:MAG: sodium:proton antiporter [Alphaproteobacteria bacterium]|jgi:monovalent cation:H+ antiporter, CPA1 family|nr:sodium:proton antiporter [Alphaproteobacteria bacterium]MBT5390412.1 sodium:proton antiporter [Alphaproteobacteria bacterium]MBT5540740.1 sodium:proton antiporter [Alphaproteobacteria bacterium]MBT5654084.1 sodium:proton antiporter [Alphaproteobacteria bacterium]
MNILDAGLPIWIVVFCLCLLFFTGIQHYTRKSLLPPECWILLGGLFYGILSRYFGDYLPLISLGHDVVILLILPVLIFAAGRSVKPQVLESEAIPIGFFSLFGVVITMFLIGLPIAYMLDIPLMHGLLFGAAISATDPAAVTAIFNRFTVPERLKLLVEGESLFNDGTAMVLFALVAGFLFQGGMFHLGNTIFAITWSLVGAFFLGVVTGWCASFIIKIWHEHHNFFPLSLTLVLALGTFLVAEKLLHVSGVVAVLMAAIVFARKQRLREQDEKHTDKARLFGSFWDYISTLINSFLFFFLGVSTGAHPYNLPLEFLMGALIFVILSRAILVYVGGGALRAVGTKLPLSWMNVLTLGGVRGAVSAALILLLPHDYAHGETFLCLVFGVIFFSLIVQPPLMALYLKSTKLPGKA